MCITARSVTLARSCPSGTVHVGNIDDRNVEGGPGNELVQLALQSLEFYLPAQPMYTWL